MSESFSVDFEDWTEPRRSVSSIYSNFSRSFDSSTDQVSFNLCYSLNLLRVVYIILDVKIASGYVKAASCHAITILVISLPENPSVDLAISERISLSTLSSTWISCGL